MRLLWASFASLYIAACGASEPPAPIEVDTLIIGGAIYDGSGSEAITTDVGITDNRIAFIGDHSVENVSADREIDASGLIVAPGFIDPHTHALSDLLNIERSQNTNYLTQGVTTVLTGNDGGGPVATGETLERLMAKEPGTNVGLFVGHGTVRRSIMGNAFRAPTDAELLNMQSLVRTAMTEGAFGLSTGLYYAPGSFAKTDEVIALTSVLKDTGGIYESHIRDESSYSVGLLPSIEEVIQIGRATGVPVHVAHIKALGVDVWGKSADVISQIEAAQKEGIRVTADQYPWSASGTRVSNALVPNWAKDGGTKAMIARLQDETLRERLDAEMSENLRKRGGADAILLTSGGEGKAGLKLSEYAANQNISPIEAARRIVIEGDARIASFNMQESDITAFMKRPWVMTSSDGTQGHPRKFASFPRKYETYVKGEKALSLSDFIHKSTGLTAETFGLCERGYIKSGYVADVVVFSPETFSQKADFSNAEVFSEGVSYLLVNGGLAIDGGEVQPTRHGEALRLTDCSTSEDTE